MRLIDANALKLEYPKDEDWEYYPVNTNSEVCETIDDMPTVDAVPVSFLLKLQETAVNDEASEIINEIIARWERERKEE